jgi:hypothetical protein
LPGNDLTTLRDAVPVAATQQATARANITTILNGIINDIEPKVTPAGLDMSSALSFLSAGVYSPATNLGYIHLQDRTATPAVNESVYVSGNELYYRDGSGTDVAITSGGSVNAAAGNVTGAGYGTPVEVNWNTASAEYRMKSGAATHSLADVVLDRCRFSDGTAQFATLGASASMAATLAFSLPVAFPAATAPMTMTSAGVMGFDTAYRELALSGSDCIGMLAAGSLQAGGQYYTQATGGEIYVPFQIADVGATITQITATTYQSGAGTLTVNLSYVDQATGAVTHDARIAHSVNGVITLSTDTNDLAYVAGRSYFLRITSTNGGSFRFYSGTIRYTL